MVNTLLKTKLHIPQTRSSLVSRDRFSQKLGENARFASKLTLVSAPAGYGKTTLVATWLESVQAAGSTQCAWLSLDKEDNDPAQFWAYFIAALQTANPNLGEEALVLLRNVQLTAVTPIITTLINELETQTPKLLLVLDDYHTIHNRAIHDGISFLINHLPAHLHLILISRADPPLPLAQLRARGQIIEIRSADLRFSEAETGHFLNDIMQLNLTQAEVVALKERTEGWAASLRLAALAMQSPTLPNQDHHHFINTFTGSNRYIVDFLLEEVLNQQPPHIQEFLLQTAVLDKLCGSLCDEILEIDDSQSPVSNLQSQTILEHLERTNLFLVPLDNERQWYRYHHLFGDLLRYRLNETYPNRVAALQYRAACWHEKNGFMTEAINYGLAARAFEWAAKLIVDITPEMFGTGKMPTLYRWLGLLPNEVILKETQLYIAYGWLLFRTGQYAAFETHLADRPASEETAVNGELTILTAHLYYIKGDFRQSISLTQQGLRLMPENDLVKRMPAITLLAWNHEAVGNLAGAIEANLQVVSMARQAGAMTGEIVSMGHLTQLFAEQGDLQRAKSSIDQALQFAHKHKINQLPLLGITYIGMGMVAFRQMEWETAVSHLQKGINLCKQWGGLIPFMIKGQVALTQVYQAQGQTEQAQRVRAEGQRMGQQQNAPAWLIKRLQSSLPSIPSGDILPASNSLTAREQGVLELMGNGRSAPQIAQELTVSVSTIRTHIKRIYAKLNVHSRHEAIQRAEQLNLL